MTREPPAHVYYIEEDYMDSFGVLGDADDVDDGYYFDSEEAAQSFINESLNPVLRHRYKVRRLRLITEW